MRERECDLSWDMEKKGKEYLWKKREAVEDGNNCKTSQACTNESRLFLFFFFFFFLNFHRNK